MKILVLENVIRKTNLLGDYGKTPVSKEVLDRIFNELENLVKISEEGDVQSLSSYLKMNNGKELKGGADHIWKYQLNDGDRILYTWGKYLPYLRTEDKDALVLLAYATHDKQGLAGKNMPPKQKYVEAKELLRTRTEFTVEDIKSPEDWEAFCELIFENSFQANHAIYIADSETLAKTDIEYLDVELTPKQGDIIDHYKDFPQPTLILGGAGTGKTVLAVHFLNDYASLRRAYFTQSNELLNYAEKRYDAISKDENSIRPDFLNINDFCRKVIDVEDLKYKDFVETNRFVKDFVKRNQYVTDILDKNNLTPIDLWTEIRGVIKGFTSERWTRTKRFNQQELNNAEIRNFKILEKNGFIQRNERNKQLFTLVTGYKKIDASNLDENAKKLLKEFIDYTHSFDPSIKELDAEEYKSLDEEVSMVETAKRDCIYKCYLKYKEWLETNNLYDDNDLALKAIAHLQKFPIDPYDFIVVDEIQDYTEIQIYLLYSIAKEFSVTPKKKQNNENCKVKTGIVFVGDSKQIINPTVFNERKLNRLFFNDDAGIELNVEHLDINFRCKQEVVDLANRVSEYRKKYIAAQKLDNKETSIHNGEKPVALLCTPNNVNLLIEGLIRFPNVAILVPNEKNRQDLIEQYGREKYEQAKNAFIYTVSEIKGMEYKYVVCYNMLTDYNDMWQIITSGRASKKTRYRYYFNLFYVSITRAQEYLCILEADKGNSLFSALEKEGELLNSVTQFDTESLFLNNLNNGETDWLLDAKANEDAGNYDRAVESYQKANADIENIWRCKAKSAEKNRDYDTCVKYLLVVESSDLKINKLDYLTRYVPELAPDSPLKNLADVYLHPEQFSQKHIHLNESLEEFYGNSENPEYRSALNEFLKKFNLHMKSILEKEVGI